MNYLNPVYTEKRECQDCYKCLRNCPVKAIKVEGGYASVMPDLCILCGQCVDVCPSGAKRVRDDLAQARQLLSGRPIVIASLAPSFVAEFPDVRPGQMIRALKRLGFHGASETALGAQQVSAQAAARLRANPGRVLISSACPTVVAYLQKHHPEACGLLTGLLSPMLTHCKILHDCFGPEIGIVFIGPCIAKKIEAAQHPELVDVVLTFEDLRRWFEQEKIAPETQAVTAEDRFVPESAMEGAWYPVEGGMIAGMKSSCAVNDLSLMSVSGLGAISRALGGLSAFKPDSGLFLELLACEGGCVNGPRAAEREATVIKRSRILQYGRPPPVPFPRPSSLAIDTTYAAAPPAAAPVLDSQIREALKLVGKFSPDDELNCGGCGYDSCREFGMALLQHKAERAMCVTHMRKLAHKKANALIQKMPSAVVIVNDQLRVIECNASFAALVSKRLPSGSAGPPQAPEGSALGELLPFASLFQNVLKTGEDIPGRDLRFQNTIFHAAIFTIEKHATVGGIIQDITEPAVHKAQVIRKAREVIQKNLSTTQKIAYLLGENAAESEITLNSIIDSFSPPRPDEAKEYHDWRKLY